MDQSTTCTITIRGVAYKIVKERQQNNKKQYISLERSINQSLCELYELKVSIEKGQLKYV